MRCWARVVLRWMRVGGGYGSGEGGGLEEGGEVGEGVGEVEVDGHDWLEGWMRGGVGCGEQGGLRKTRVSVDGFWGWSLERKGDCRFLRNGEREGS